MSEVGLRIIPATTADIPTLRNLIQFYVYDFSELWAGEMQGELLPSGRFGEYFPLASFFERAGWRAFLLEIADAPVGFALINDDPHSGLPTDHSVAEFFVVRKHRTTGVGREAAERLFRGSPGKWEAAVMRKNIGALAFWRRVVSACAVPGSVKELDFDNDDWNGPILRFEIAPLDAARS
ncbi:MAG TPA: GNAT family N-acetyltransferase [Caulobacteraceae bacterium]|nr:GNAT family N-acetyltransferase [Caulobacteraceae bacterium]